MQVHHTDVQLSAWKHFGRIKLILREPLPSHDSRPEGCRSLNALSNSFLLFVFQASCWSFIADVLLRCQQKTYASRPAFPENSCRIVALQYYYIKLGLMTMVVKTFISLTIRRKSFVNTYLVYMPKAIECCHSCSLLCLQSQSDLGWV